MIRVNLLGYKPVPITYCRPSRGPYRTRCQPTGLVRSQIGSTICARRERTEEKIVQHLDQAAQRHPHHGRKDRP